MEEGVPFVPNYMMITHHSLASGGKEVRAGSCSIKEKREV